MAKGFKTSGRTKGTPNRDKQALRERLSFLYPDYDPILAMVEMANDSDGTGFKVLRIPNQVFEKS